MQKILQTTQLKYILLKKLGEGGSCCVYKGYCLLDNNQRMLAIKLYKTENKKDFEKEISIHKILPQKFFLTLISYGNGYIYLNSEMNKKENEILKKEEIFYKIEELSENGDLFDYIYLNNKGFSEKIAAKIFVNILKLVKIFHNKKFVHKDIKPENILIANDYSIKLIDFSYSEQIDNKNNNLIFSIKGSEIYSPPEIKKGNSSGYDGIKSDIFSLGVLLYVITLNRFPFCNCSYSDKKFRLIMTKNYEKYWSNFKDDNITNEFKNLINHLICFNADDRFNINQILQHQWIKNNCNEKDLDDSYFINEDITNELKRRKQLWNKKDKLN